MSADVNILARVRKLYEGLDSSSVDTKDNQVVLNNQLELLIAAACSPNQETTRMGRSWYVNTVAAIAAVVAIPTTAHMLAIYNNEPDTGRSLIIEWLAASGVAKTAAAGQQQILGNIGQVRETPPTDALLGIKKMNGLGTSLDTMVRTILNATALPGTTGIAGNWFPVGPSFGSPGAAATPGNGAWIEVAGRIIVPPGRYFAMHVLADVVGSTYQAFIGFSQKQLVLG